MAAPRLCSIPGCDKPHKARGWCTMHYTRWKSHGDPLKTLTAPTGEPERFYRDVVLAYDGNECLFWPFSKTPAGYGSMTNNGGSNIVSRRLCEEINGHPPTPKHDAAHSCGKGHMACVTKGHLSWKTHAENGADMVLHGSSPRGDRHGVAKLTEDQVREIRALKGRQRQRETAVRFGISGPTVSMIQAGRRWSWL